MHEFLFCMQPEASAAASDEWKVSSSFARRVCSFNDLFYWFDLIPQSMDAFQRAKYDQQAKGTDGGWAAVRGGGGATHKQRERYSAQGVPFSELDRQRAEKECRDKYIVTQIRKFVDDLSFPKGTSIELPVTVFFGNA